MNHGAVYLKFTDCQSIVLHIYIYIYIYTYSWEIWTREMSFKVRRGRMRNCDKRFELLAISQSSLLLSQSSSPPSLLVLFHAFYYEVALLCYCFREPHASKLPTLRTLAG